MLIESVHRYIVLRRSLGFKLVKPARHLISFADYAADVGDRHIRNDTVMAWAVAHASTPGSLYRRLQEVACFARYLHAEDPAHEIPQHRLYYKARSRPAPYIFAPDEIARMIETARGLPASRLNPLRPHTYEMLFGLLAATGLRISEATGLRLDDVLPEGVLHIRVAKFNKSRLVPLHPSVKARLDAYLRIRTRYVGCEDRLFVTECGQPLPYNTAKHCFDAILRRADIGQDRQRRPRIHDLRHTFATRVLEQCRAGSDEIARDFVALSTYLGHGNIKHTYWYLEATPDLMCDMAAAAEALVCGRPA